MEHIDCTVPISNTACFTGPRPKKIFADSPYAEEKRKDYQKIVDRVADLIELLIASGMKRFITGGAPGFDQLAFWAVNKCRKRHPEIINDVCIPFRGQELRWAKIGIFSQAEYRKMLSLTSNVFVCRDNIDTSDYRTVIKALDYRNECMVDLSGTVIGRFADDSWRTATKGGTVNCLKYVDRHGKRLIVQAFDHTDDFRNTDMPENPFDT